MKKLVSVLTIICFAATPVAGSVRDAAFSSSGDQHALRTSVFVGAAYRVGLHPKDKDRGGQASLRIAGMRMKQDSSEIRFGEGLKLSGGKAGRPVLQLAGQDVSELKKRAQMSSGGKIAVVVGVVALAGAVAFGVWALNATYCDRQECE